jgi:hypothetical protein
MSDPSERIPHELEIHLRWLLDPATMETPDPDGVCIACRHLRNLGWLSQDEHGIWQPINVWEMV